MKKQGLGIVVRSALIFVVAIILVVGIVNPVFGYESPGHNESLETRSDGKKDYLIGFYREPGRMEVNMVELLGGEIFRQFEFIDVIAATMTPEAASKLAGDRSVKYIEIDAPVYATNQDVPWGIERVFGNESYEFDTWNYTRGDGVAVAILDSGISINHEDLHSQILGGINTLQGARPDNYNDGHGHGTHVAGTVAAIDNDLGVVGVGPEIGLYAVKVMDDQGRGTWSSVAAGIEWTVEQNIPLLNMSLGGADGQTLRDACNAAHAAGHLLVAAAGNSGNYSGTGNNVVYPAGYDNVIAVAASDRNDNRSFFSSTGPQVELIAPGQGILSTWVFNTYTAASGTSMASPHVAGVAALTWAANPDLTHEEVRALLQDTAEDLNLPANHQGLGMVRADLAVRAALDSVEPAIGSIEGVVAGEGDVVLEGASVVVEGTDLAVTTDSDGYYHLEDVPAGEHDVSVTAEGYHERTITVTVEKDATTSQNFLLDRIIPAYTIVATSGSGGEIKPSAAVTVYEGEDQTFMIIPDNNYIIEDVLIDDESVGAVSSYTFNNVTSDHTIHADFTSTDAYTVSGRVTDQDGEALAGVSVVLEETGLSAVTGSDGSYQIPGVLEGTYMITAAKDGYNSASTEVTVSEDLSGVDFTLTSKAGNIYTIMSTAGEGGEIEPSAAVAVYAGESQSFTISPDRGYVISEVLVDDASVGAVDSYTFENVYSDHTIHADFEVTPTYKIKGRVTDSDGDPLERAVLVLHKRWLIAITEADGTYEFSGLKEGTYKVSALMNDYEIKTREITISEDTSDLDFVLTKREESTYTITSSAGSGGQISPSKQVNVKAGESITFDIKPNAGYIIGDVLVDGESVNPVESYTFDDVKSDHAIQAEFAATSTYSLMGFFNIFIYNVQEIAFDRPEGSLYHLLNDNEGFNSLFTAQEDSLDLNTFQEAFNKEEMVAIYKELLPLLTAIENK